MSFNNYKNDNSSKRRKVYKDENEALKASFLDLKKQRIEKYILGNDVFERLNSVPDVRTDVTAIIQGNLKEIANLKKSLHNSRTKQVEYRTELEEKKVSLKAMQACVRQYESKFKKVREVTMAGLERQTDILETANAYMEREEHTEKFEINSDKEDEHENNKVSYSYVDHDIFNN